jgi:bifunctional DNA-binding transcriptional regulator/antitoxin component of YhaV-PrlF toxin-antitoxin module
MQLELLRENLNDETLQKLDLMEANERLVKENYMLKESCENFSEVEKNLHQKLNKLKDLKEELLQVLSDLTEQCRPEIIATFEDCRPYNKAKIVLDRNR